MSVRTTSCLCFNGKLAHRESASFLELLCRSNAQLMFRQCSPHCARFLRPQVFWYVPTLLVELAQVLLLRLVNDSQDASYRLPHHATAQNTEACRFNRKKNIYIKYAPKSSPLYWILSKHCTCQANIMTVNSIFVFSLYLQ